MLFFELNDGWLPNRGSVRLGGQVGDQVSYVCFGVIDDMSVPIILGNSFGDTEVKTISCEDQTVTLSDGDGRPHPARHG